MQGFKLIAIGALAGLLVGCATSPSQSRVANDAVSAKSGTEPVKMVRVTGSRIRVPEEQFQSGHGSIYPLYVITRQELYDIGATSVADGLNQLPFINAGQ